MQSRPCLQRYRVPILPLWHLVVVLSAVTRAQYLNTIDPNAIWSIGEASQPTLITWDDELISLNDTAVQFGWTLNTVNKFQPSLPDYFDLEITDEPNSYDFVVHTRIPVIIPVVFSNNSYVTNFTVGSLISEKGYAFRIIPIFASGRGYPSVPLVIETLAPAQNYWEPIITRRQAMEAQGYGFAYPVAGRAHLSTGVEINEDGTSNNPYRYANPTTGEQQKFPSGRRGHTMSPVGSVIYTFGGKANGYSCSDSFFDILNLGVSFAGRYVFQCSTFSQESNEMWRFNTGSYQWDFINTTKWLDINITTNELVNSSLPENQVPAPREQHTSAVVDNGLYVFGGKSRIFVGYDDDGVPKYDGAYIYDKVYGDLWLFAWKPQTNHYAYWREQRIAISETSTISVKYNATDNAELRALSDGESPREGLCIDKLVVTVVVDHPCINQVELSLRGPGATYFSADYFPSADQWRVPLYTQSNSNGTGCAGGIHTLVFDDDAPLRMEEGAVSKYPYQSGLRYMPDGKLGEYIGTSMTAVWRLEMKDTDEDGISGHLISFDLQFTASECFEKYTWTDLSHTVDNTQVPARSGAKSITHGNNIFFFGGYDSNGNVLNDLHRFHTTSQTWKTLTPSRFSSTPLETAMSVGSNYVLTVHGVIRFAGYFRLPELTEANAPLPLSQTGVVPCELAALCETTDGGSYDNSVYVLDPTTLKWRLLTTFAQPLNISANSAWNAGRPNPRYLSASGFIPAHAIPWRTQYGDRILYDRLMDSTKANHAGIVSDSLVVFGGFDGASGAMKDGSNGGYMNDMFVLRLGNLSTPGARYNTEKMRATKCKWRASTSSTQTCLSSAAGAVCDFKDLLMLAWCAGRNQTMA